jgi:hypothetical protein
MPISFESSKPPAPDREDAPAPAAASDDTSAAPAGEAGPETPEAPREEREPAAGEAPTAAEAGPGKPARPELVVVPPMPEDAPAPPGEAEPGVPEPPSLMDSTAEDLALSGSDPPAGAIATAELQARAISTAPLTPPPVSIAAERSGADEAEQAPSGGEGEAANVKAHPSWTATRREDSVLFSMNQLRSVASSVPSPPARTALPPAAEPPAEQSPAERPSATDSEDSSSRLYDIRAIAAATIDAHPTVVDHGMEELFNMEVGGFRDPAADSPVALPAPKPQHAGGLVYAVFALAAVTLVANGVLGGALYLHIEAESARPVTVVLNADDLRSGVDPGRLAALLDPARPDAGEVPVTDPWTEAVPDDPGEPATDAGLAGSSDGGGAGSSNADERTGRRGEERDRDHAAERAPADASVEPAPVAPSPTPPPETRPRPAERTTPSPLANTLTEVLGEGDEVPAPAGEGGDANLPETLSASQVASVMSGLASRVRRCGDGTHGTITINATIAGSGRVTSSTVTGDYAGTAVGSCAARTVRGAQFPRFRQPSTSVRYPFPI